MQNQIIVSDTVEIAVPFNGIESELSNLGAVGIEVVKLGLGGGGNVEAVLRGEEIEIRNYLARLWDVLPNDDEINDLFEVY